METGWGNQECPEGASLSFIFSKIENKAVPVKGEFA
jgi:hypothetical protein